ncbi:hypothetical protein [Paenibacillus chungangensis]|uniref:Histidine kinase n=1 Tax=Paenibacillus chungangensis TaxID=696535 RepID=A0ABW3HXL4_9BACL
MKHTVYLLMATAMIFYAMPHLELGGPLRVENLFWFIWLSFSVLAVGANVNVLLMSEEKRKELVRVKRAKALAWERRITDRAAERNKGGVRGMR